MRRFLLLYFMLGVSTFSAQAKKTCDLTSNSKNLNQVVEVIKTNFHVGERREVIEHSCHMKMDTSDFENAIAANVNKAGEKPVDKKSHGIKFENESPALIKIFDQLTSRERRLLDVEHEFSSSCNKVLCAVKEIFGADVGPRLLYLVQEYGLNASHLSFLNAGAWTAQELDDLIPALEDLPKGMFPLDNNRPFMRVRNAALYMPNNPDARLPGPDMCVAATHQLAFYDCLWSGVEGLVRTTQVTHELAHYISEELGRLDDGQEWMALSGWQKHRRPGLTSIKISWSKGEDGCFLSDRGQANPSEDFAEAFVAYRYTPKRLRDYCPGKYSFIKEKIFKGMEFTSDQKFCEKRPRLPGSLK